MLRTFGLAMAVFALPACVANQAASPAQPVVFRPPAPFLAATGDDLVIKLTARPITYVRRNGQAVTMTFHQDGRLTTVNPVAQRISNGLWEVSQSGMVCQVYTGSRFCSEFSWQGAEPNRLFINWDDGTLMEATQQL